MPGDGFFSRNAATLRQHDQISVYFKTGVSPTNYSEAIIYFHFELEFLRFCNLIVSGLCFTTAHDQR
jgi:hypothetical protein